MLNRRRILATSGEGGLHRRAELLLPVLFAQLKERDHLLRAFLLAVTLNQALPKVIKAGGPAPGLAPLVERLAPGECAGLVVEGVEVMLQIEKLLVAPIAALVHRQSPPLVPDFNRC